MSVFESFRWDIRTWMNGDEFEDGCVIVHVIRVWLVFVSHFVVSINYVPITLSLMYSFSK